jgi:hypothetical protein
MALLWKSKPTKGRWKKRSKHIKANSTLLVEAGIAAGYESEAARNREAKSHENNALIKTASPRTNNQSNKQQ